MLKWLKTSFCATLLLFSMRTQAQQPLSCDYTQQESYEYFKQNFPTLLTSAGSQLTVEQFTALKSLQIGNLGFSDEDIPYICSLTQLESLSIYNDGAEQKLTGKNLAYLSFLVNLDNLDLDGNDLISEDLQKISSLSKLRIFKIGVGNNLSGSLKALEDFAGLVHVTFEGNAGLTKESFLWLKNSPKVWESLTIYGPQNIDESAVDEVFAFAKVKKLSLFGIPFQNAEKFSVFSQNEYIQKISWDSPSWSQEQILKAYAFIFQIPNLRTVDISFLTQPEGVIDLLTPQIKELIVKIKYEDLENGKILKTTETILQKIPRLEKLSFTWDQLDHMIFQYLSEVSFCKPLNEKYKPTQIIFLTPFNQEFMCI